MSKPVGRNNSKIITRNQGGGNKKQGLAPLATQFFISQANNVQYRTESGDGRSRDLVICVNQLGGVGKGRSQFRPNADGNRGTFCVKPLLSIFHDNRLITLNPEVSLTVILNRFDIANKLSGFSHAILGQGGFMPTPMYSLSPNEYKVNFGGVDLDICSNSEMGFTSNSGSNYFTILHFGGGNTFIDNTYEYLKSLKSIATISEISIGQRITNLLSGYNLTITSRSNPSQSLNFNSLTNENYYYWRKNWYKQF